MEAIAEVRIGPFLVVPLLLVAVLCLLDASWARMLHSHHRSSHPNAGVGYQLGLALGVWLQPVIVAVLGVVAILGNQIALIFFALGTIWRAVPPGREFSKGFLAGFEESSGESRPSLAAGIGAAWIGLTRGIPLMLLFGFLRAA